MRIICVDNNKRNLFRLMERCRRAARVSDVVGFATEREALAWLRDHPCDIALIQATKPGFDGLRLAANASVMRPETAVVFVAEEKDEASEAVELRPIGYLLEPTLAERALEDIEYVKGVLSGRRESGV